MWYIMWWMGWWVPITGSNMSLILQIYWSAMFSWCWNVKLKGNRGQILFWAPWVECTFWWRSKNTDFFQKLSLVSKFWPKGPNLDKNKSQSSNTPAASQNIQAKHHGGEQLIVAKHGVGEQKLWPNILVASQEIEFRPNMMEASN